MTYQCIIIGLESKLCDFNLSKCSAVLDSVLAEVSVKFRSEMPQYSWWCLPQVVWVVAVLQQVQDWIALFAEPP